MVHILYGALPQAWKTESPRTAASSLHGHSLNPLRLSVPDSRSLVSSQVSIVQVTRDLKDALSSLLLLYKDSPAFTSLSYQDWPEVTMGSVSSEILPKSPVRFISL